MSEILRERYSVEHELGRGRFAIVSAVRDLQTGAALVLKRIPLGKALERVQGLDALGGSASEKILELFRREARVLGGLLHPGIPRHVDSFVVEKPGDMELCLVQERVDGKSLRDHLLAGRRFSETEVLAIARSAAEILSYLHELDPPVVHRDIKPGNVILREDGSIALIDFGAVMDAIAPEWGGSTIIGTVGYMPLEQYEGRATPASDVYSLGATLVHLLSQKEPAAGVVDAAHGLDRAHHRNHQGRLPFS